MRPRHVPKLAAARIRRRFYVERAEPIPPYLARPRRLIDDDPSAVGSRRIEIGCGWYPTPGYIHIDPDLNARHVEIRADAWALPFENDWAQEILAVHILEHILPAKQPATLREWHRVLDPCGILRVHVPNAPAMMRAYLDGDALTKWRLSGALLGQYCGPEFTSPSELTVRSDHQALLDAELLATLLTDAGFVHLQENHAADRHAEAWDAMVHGYSLAFTAHKPPR